jgi:hypothetical protein
MRGIERSEMALIVRFVARSLGSAALYHLRVSGTSRSHLAPLDPLIRLASLGTFPHKGGRGSAPGFQATTLKQEGRSGGPPHIINDA